MAKAEALAVVARSGAAIVRFEWVRPTLEDVFLELVGENGAGRATQPVDEATTRVPGERDPAGDRATPEPRP
jgi:hypothetical protein